MGKDEGRRIMINQFGNPNTDTKRKGFAFNDS